MAITQGRYRAATRLDLIQLLDQYERTHGFRSILQDEDAAHTRVVLFEYHIVGTFASEAAAEVAFSRLAEQQKQLLADETAKLIRGDCAPLKIDANRSCTCCRESSPSLTSASNQLKYNLERARDMKWKEQNGTLGFGLPELESKRSREEVQRHSLDGKATTLKEKASSNTHHE